MEGRDRKQASKSVAKGDDPGIRVSHTRLDEQMQVIGNHGSGTKFPDCELIGCAIVGGNI